MSNDQSNGMRRPQASPIVISRLLALIWMAILFYLSDQPSLPTPSLFPGQDKLFHLLAYGVLGSFVLVGMRPTANGFTTAQVALTTLLVGLYGLSDEIHQYFVPGRSAEVFDVVADTLGGLLAAGLLRWLANAYLYRSAEQ
jgi:VanZ family protein